MTTELAKGVYWVGAVDWGLRFFHGFELSTHRGSSYNSYLIVDDKVALVDAVWDPFQDELLRNIREIIDPARIDYVIGNHSEMDHSGALPLIMRNAPNATLVVSKRGLDSFEGHYHHAWKVKAVQSGDRIPLGKTDLVFLEAPMLHWPDSMFTYSTAHRILMPNDAFGQHYATAFRFNDQVNEEELYEEALKYYANIVQPYSNFVTKKIQEIEKLNLPIDMIAPSHGVIWRKDPAQIVRKYAAWARQTPEKTAVILYDTMWQGTRKMAEAIGRGLASAQTPYKIFFMPTADRNDVITELFKTRAIIIGSPTLNKVLLPSISPILEDLKGHRMPNKIGAAFGSHGWSGEGVKLIEHHLQECGIPLAAPGVACKWQPGDKALAECEALGAAVAKAIWAES